MIQWIQLEQKSIVNVLHIIIFSTFIIMKTCLNNSCIPLFLIDLQVDRKFIQPIPIPKVLTISFLLLKDTTLIII